MSFKNHFYTTKITNKSLIFENNFYLNFDIFSILYNFLLTVISAGTLLNKKLFVLHFSYLLPKYRHITLYDTDIIYFIST